MISFATGSLVDLAKPSAILAQLVEQCFCKASVAGSSPVNGFTHHPKHMTFKAPKRLSEDSWFPLPECIREKYAAEMKYDVSFDPITGQMVDKEPFNVHEWAYQQATMNSSTTLTIDPPGGSENLL